MSQHSLILNKIPKASIEINVFSCSYILVLSARNIMVSNMSKRQTIFKITLLNHMKPIL